MSEIDDTLIQRGLWTNVGAGTIMGKTITMESRAGAICVAILAVMSTVGKDVNYCMMTVPDVYSNLAFMEPPDLCLSSTSSKGTSL